VVTVVELDVNWSSGKTVATVSLFGSQGFLVDSPNLETWSNVAMWGIDVELESLYENESDFSPS
jgi:hypothetical protein